MFCPCSGLVCRYSVRRYHLTEGHSSPLTQPRTSGVGELLDESLAVLVLARIDCALTSPEARFAKVMAGFCELTDEPTAGQLLHLVILTGLDPLLLFASSEDVFRGLDDLPHWDVHSVTDSDQL